MVDQVCVFLKIFLILSKITFFLLLLSYSLFWSSWLQEFGESEYWSLWTLDVTNHVDADETTSLPWLHCETTEDRNRNQVILCSMN